MNILLGVCGSISAYKTIDLARGLVKKGHSVRVVLTKGATEFVVANVYSYLGVEKVYTFDEDFNYPKTLEDKGTVLHIELAKWADQFLIVPLTANTLANLAMGKASDLLSSIYLAYSQEKNVTLFPAMNTLMYEHPLTQANLNLVQRLEDTPNTSIYPPEHGLLACGDMGAGKLPDVEKILDTYDLFNQSELTNRKVVITTGATIAPLDPVRYLTNPSSGLTGFYLAKEALKKGLEVVVLAGVHATKKLDYLNAHPNFEIKRVTTTTQMRDLALQEIKEADAYISSAALCDFEFEYQDSKIKKQQSTNTLAYIKAPDVLREVLDKVQNENFITIGFAAETEVSLQLLEQKWQRKPVDLLVGTHVHSGLKGSTQKGFQTTKATYSFYENNQISFQGELTKEQLAHYLIERVLS